jgi:hypothetical protein
MFEHGSGKARHDARIGGRVNPAKNPTANERDIPANMKYNDLVTRRFQK